MNLNKGYELNDLLLVPKQSTVNSREEVNLSTIMDMLSIKIPIIASPMSGIVGVQLITELGKLGGLGILHRFYSDDIKRTQDTATLSKHAPKFGIAVGLNDTFYKYALSMGAEVICVDVANGYLDSVAKFTKEVADYICKHGYYSFIMSGNVATYEGSKRLFESGATLIRTGIGSGQLCTTRMNTGVGVPQASAIYNCSHKVQNIHLHDTYLMQSHETSDWFTVADGGIKNSGDAVKALALGADFIMLGSLFARCYESDNNGKIQGMASREFQEQFYGIVKKSVEGVQKEVGKDISIEDFIKEFVWNMKSGFTYLNSKNIRELHKNAEFIGV
jgi:IMP dehydrogenase